MTDENFTAALEEILKIEQTSIAFFGVPLALLLSQLGFLNSLGGFWTSIFASISAIALTFGLYLAVDSAYRLRALLAKEKLLAGGNSDGKGFKYLAWFEKTMGNANIEISEDALVAHAEWLQRPVRWIFFIGYSSLVLLLILAIWTGPSS